MDAQQGDGVGRVWSVVTDFADVAVTVPLTVLAVMYLVLAARRVRLAVALALAVSGTGAVMLALKLVLGACSNGGGLIHSPSGHSAMAMVVYGGGAVLASLRSPRRWPMLAAALVWVLLIGVSRVALAAHTPAEVVAGLAVGAAFTALFAGLVRDEGPLTLHRRPMLALAVLSIAVTYGLNAPAEEAIKKIALGLRGHLLMCEGSRS